MRRPGSEARSRVRHGGRDSDVRRNHRDCADRSHVNSADFSLRKASDYSEALDLVACKRILKFAAAQAGYRQCNAPFCFESRWCGPGKEEDKSTNRQTNRSFVSIQGLVSSIYGKVGPVGPGRVAVLVVCQSRCWSSAVTVPSSTGPSDLPGSGCYAMINLNLKLVVA